MLYKDMGVRPILTFPSDALSNTIFVRFDSTMSPDLENKKLYRFNNQM